MNMSARSIFGALGDLGLGADLVEGARRRNSSPPPVPDTENGLFG